MSSKVKKVLGNGLFLLLCAGLTGYFVLRGQDFDALLQYMSNSSQRYWIAGFALVVAFILCESFIIHYLLRAFGEKPNLVHCFLYSFVGFFFSLVTPTASGGQPMQLVFMKRDNLHLSRCIIALLLVTIAYKSVLVIIGLVIIFVQPSNIMPYLDPAMFWIILGIVLNVACVAGMLVLVFAPSVARKIAFGCIRFSGKFFGKERAEGWLVKIEEAMGRYEEASYYIKNHIVVSVNVMILTIFQRVLLFAVTYVVFLSFDINVFSLVQTVFLQGSISLSADMLPLPGGLGISEYLFTQIFSPVIGEALTTSTMVISRGLSFYAQLLVSALFTVVAYFVIFGAKKGEDK